MVLDLWITTNTHQTAVALPLRRGKVYRSHTVPAELLTGPSERVIRALFPIAGPPSFAASVQAQEAACPVRRALSPAASSANRTAAPVATSNTAMLTIEAAVYPPAVGRPPRDGIEPTSSVALRALPIENPTERTTWYTLIALPVSSFGAPANICNGFAAKTPPTPAPAKLIVTTIVP
jgi:hypothetical protein